MFIETKSLSIRALDFKDQENLFKIVWQKDVMRFMRDWSDEHPTPESFHDYIQWQKQQQVSKDMYLNKRYAVVLQETDLLIGMVGMGLEDTLNEIEMAYFIDEDYQGNGYATEALQALFEWCMSVSTIPYMILTIDCANAASCKVASKSGFELFEKRTPIGHEQPNMESESYYYYRKYRKASV
ncbi:MAG: GNAT family N-acetyltransferase [Niameybacter sp.]|uniref:GNAT family N-acetyltransferase n=1 Tax=Niameybacter sp. TaxID=2033640 RepID=UPI002FC879FD